MIHIGNTIKMILLRLVQVINLLVKLKLKKLEIIFKNLDLIISLVFIVVHKVYILLMPIHLSQVHNQLILLIFSFYKNYKI